MISKKGKRQPLISKMIAWLLGLDLILLSLMSLKSDINIEIIKIFSDVTKVLAGALAGAIAGERYNE